VTGRISPFLRGPYAPIFGEHEAADLPVTGTLPAELDGLFTQIGPNPVTPPRYSDADRYSWFTQDGMVCGVRLRDGRAQWARNRWIGSRRVTRAQGKPTTPGPRHMVSDTVHTNIVYHGGMLLALVETGCLPARLSPTLETIEYTDLAGALPRGFAAHPKLDPLTGELIAVSYSPLRTTVDYIVLNRDGGLAALERIPIGARPMMHDIALTPNHVIVFDFSVRFAPAALTRGRFPFRWDHRNPARLGVISRKHPSARVRWFEVPPSFIFHTVNAYEEDDRIVVDAIRYGRLFDTASGDYLGGTDAFSETGLPWRWTLDLKTGMAQAGQADETGQELPRINPRRIGQTFRYSYAVSGTDDSMLHETSLLIKRDFRTGDSEKRKHPEGQSPTEPVFVPRGEAEDDGWILHYLIDPARKASSLVVLAAQDFTGPPVATIELPFKVPFGFHSSWITAGELKSVQDALPGRRGRPVQ
jgi:carotenoid cleavage dioxygenase-like enzyme